MNRRPVKAKNTLSKKRLNGRILIVGAFFLIFVAYMIYKVTFIKLVQGEDYQKQVYDRLISMENPIPPQRGNIYDRNYKTIATSFLTYDITLSPKDILEQDADKIAALYEALSQALGKTVPDIKALVEKKPNSQYALLGKNIDSEVAEKLKAQGLRGVWFKKSFIRKYPKGQLAAHLIGFYNKNGEGQYGIEQQYNEYMLGVEGREFSQLQSEQIITTEMKAVENGDNIILTIDEVVQQYVEQAMKKYIDEYKPLNAATVIMNPNTGEIYAMYSYPSFDPNNNTNLEAQLGKGNWAALSDQQRTEKLYAAWKNFNTQNSYELGSTFKPLLVAMALDENVISKDAKYNCTGAKQVADRLIHCWNRAPGHGLQSVEEALANSCNVAMMEIAEKIDYDVFLNYMNKYGFGKPTGIKLPGEEVGLLHNKLGPVERATYAIGQTFTATTVQLITAFSSVINGGYLLEPLVVSDIVDEQGNVIYHAKPVIRRQVISKETSDTVKEYLQKVVDEGTGHRASVNGYKVGGKTGTAQKGDRTGDNYVLSFIGYAPIENPEIIALVVFDEAPEHSGVPAMAFKDMMENILPYLGIETNNEVVEESEEIGEVPSIVDKDIYEAYRQLQAQGLDYIVGGGVGQKISMQYPKAGTHLPKGSSVRVYMKTEDDAAELIEVPKVVGLTIDEAKSLVGHEFTIVGSGSGKVTAQIPKEKQKIEKNSQIIVQTSD